MDGKSFVLGAVVGTAAGLAASYFVIKPKLEAEMFKKVDKLVGDGIESYKQGLDRAADGVISSKEAVNIVKAVQKKMEEGDKTSSESPSESFSSLEDEEEANEEEEPTDYAGVYDQYNKPKPSELFNYTDDVPNDILDNQLDLEAEAVVQSNIERIEEFQKEMAEREYPVEETDEARSRRRNLEREKSKNAYPIDEEKFFDSNREYDKEALLYYKKDRVLCYENEEVIVDREELFGPNHLQTIDALNNVRVTSESGTSLYFRNEFLKTDYEIIVYAGSYEHFVNGPSIN